MSVTLEKFPNLELGGRRLVWDSRQVPDGRPEKVFVPDDLDAPVRAALLARTSAEFVTGPYARAELGRAAAAAAGHPSRALTVVAVTGTNGKTTCARIAARILAAAGARVAEIGTLGVSLFDAGVLEPTVTLESGFTTPDAPILQGLFRQFVREGFTHVTMEASSHAAALARVEGTEFDGLLFTNLTQDHLDFHGTMAAYEAAKASLFHYYLPASSKRTFAVIHVDDPAGQRIFAQLPASVAGFALEEQKNFRVLRSDLHGQELEWNGRTFRTGLIGGYNAKNLVGAAQLAEEALKNRAPAGYRPEQFMSVLQRALTNFAGTPGRMERVGASAVFVDYAHTPDALEKALQLLADLKPASSQLTVVFGCGGNRDRAKRPLMGAIAARLADRVILTSDNPRAEDPLAILREIRVGVANSGGVAVEEIPDREAAIRAALERMEAGDICLVAGKGHENYQIVGAQKRHFSDVETSAKVLQELAAHSKPRV